VPELPDVAGFKQYLDATALHQPIATTSVPDERILRGTTAAALGRRLKGRPLSRTHRHGKFLFAEAEGAGWLVLHFGMTGELHYGKSDADEPDHACLKLEFTNGYHLTCTSRRMLGRVSYAESVDRFVTEEELGPDALDDSAITPSGFVAMLQGRRGSLKGLFMDQSHIAGIGNVWSDEICFQARLHPGTQPRRFSAAQLRKVHGRMRHVLSLGAKCGGLGAMGSCACGFACPASADSPSSANSEASAMLPTPAPRRPKSARRVNCWNCCWGFMVCSKQSSFATLLG